MERWKPNVTVATVISRVNQGITEYLMVHEVRDGKAVYNQPAGHLDEGESLITAAERETLEETAWKVRITGLIGIYRFVAANGITYLRHAFAAEPLKHLNSQTLDSGIIEAVWMSTKEIEHKKAQLRSAMVQETINDYEQGQIYPLTLLREPS